MFGPAMRFARDVISIGVVLEVVTKGRLRLPDIIFGKQIGVAGFIVCLTHRFRVKRSATHNCGENLCFAASVFALRGDVISYVMWRFGCVRHFWICFVLCRVAIRFVYAIFGFPEGCQRCAVFIMPCVQFCRAGCRVAGVVEQDV